MSHNHGPRVIYITAGAAGMFCGSCMHDNALAKSLTEIGWDIQLVPTYTPIRTDEQDISVDQVFFGGINVYLQQKVPFLRYLPGWLDRFLDNPKLIRRVTANAMDTDPKMLGQLSLSMLKGLKGNQRKEVKRLCNWLKAENPDLIVFSNILIGGCIPELKRILNIPVLVTLQGDDVFLDSLSEQHKAQCIEQIQRIASHVDGFIVHSQFFRDYMSGYFDIDSNKIHVTPLGIDVDDYSRYHREHLNEKSRQPQKTIGYLAKLAPQKGLHNLVDAFIMLKSKPNTDHIRLEIAGWLGPENKDYANQLFEKLNQAGLANDYDHLGVIDREQKLEMLGRIDLLSVPTEFLEPKGLYALEALAAGVPVVLPNHACFPELVQAAEGGLLYDAGDTSHLADQWLKLLNEPDQCLDLAIRGRQFVLENRNAISMANETSELFRRFLA